MGLAIRSVITYFREDKSPSQLSKPTSQTLNLNSSADHVSQMATLNAQSLKEQNLIGPSLLHGTRLRYDVWLSYDSPMNFYKALNSG